MACKAPVCLSKYKIGGPLGLVKSGSSNQPRHKPSFECKADEMKSLVWRNFNFLGLIKSNDYYFTGHWTRKQISGPPPDFTLWFYERLFLLNLFPNAGWNYNNGYYTARGGVINYLKKNDDFIMALVVIMT